MGRMMYSSGSSSSSSSDAYPPKYEFYEDTMEKVALLLYDFYGYELLHKKYKMQIFIKDNNNELLATIQKVPKKVKLLKVESTCFRIECYRELDDPLKIAIRRAQRESACSTQVEGGVIQGVS